MAVASTIGNVAYYLTDMKKTVADFIADESLKHPVSVNKVEAARDVAMAISNTYSACEFMKILITLRDKVDATVQKQLKELESMLEALKSDNTGSILDLKDRVQRYIQSLGLAAWQPKWTGMSPRYAYVVNGRFSVTLFGVFTHALADAARYNLTVKNCNVEKKKQADSLSFDIVPQAGFFPEWANSICYLFEGQLEVDFRSWGSAFSGTYKAKYDVWLATHPLACKISLSLPQIVIKETLKRNFRSATYSLDRKDFQTTEAVERKQTIWATEGWRISSTPTFYSNAARDHQPQGKLMENYVLMILTLPKGRDKISAYLEFEVSKDLLDEKETTSTHELEWGKSLEINSEKFSLKFKTFEGKEYTLSPTQIENPYFAIEKLPNNAYKATLVPPIEPTKV